jgi:hypothetical protein
MDDMDVDVSQIQSLVAKAGKNVWDGGKEEVRFEMNYEQFPLATLLIIVHD